MRKKEREMRGHVWGAGSILASVLLLLAMPAHAITVATFADPAEDALSPVFEVTVDTVNGKVTGGWPDSRTNLDLLLPIVGPNPPGIDSYADAWFRMSELSYTGTVAAGTTGPGTIEFFADGDPGNTVLLSIAFDSAQVTFRGLYADNIVSMNNVVFGGLETTEWTTVDEESFAFSFGNQTLIPDPNNPGGPPIGYTATASFTSSADVFIPEPSVLALMGLGAPLLWMYRRAR
jgi:hypothetical protein